MRENGAICAFLLSILVFSSFTPYAYAFGGKAAPVAAAVEMGVAQDPLELQGAECSTSTLTVAEYKKLLAFANESIDFLGNRQAELDAQQKEKLGIKPEVPEAEGRMVMGVDRPIAIQEVVGREAIFQNGTCFLKNSVVRGTLAYAALLDRQYRMCINSTNVNCMAGALSDAEKDDLSKRLGQYEESLSKVTNTTAAEAEIQRQRNELADVKFSPLNFMTTETGSMGVASNGGNIFLLPRTIETFLNWLKVFEPLDKVAAVAAIAGLGVGVAQIARGGIRALMTRSGREFGPGAFVNELKSLISRPVSVSKFKNVLQTANPDDVAKLKNALDRTNVDEVYDRLQAIEKAKSAAEQRGFVQNAGDKMKGIKTALERTGLEDTQMYRQIENLGTKRGIRWVDGIDVSDAEGAVSLGDAGSFLATLSGKLPDGSAQKLFVEAQREALAAAERSATVTSGKRFAKAAVDEMLGTAEGTDVLEYTINLGTYKSWFLKDTFDIIDPASALPSLIDTFKSARDAGVALQVASTTGSVGTGLFQRLSQTRAVGALGRAAELIPQSTKDLLSEAIGNGFRWAAAQTLVLESLSLLTNVLIRKPLLEVQGLQFDLNKDHSAFGKNAYFQIDVLTPFKQSDVLPQSWILDTLVAYGLGELLQDDAAKQKMQSIGNYVYIHDTASPKPSLVAGEDAIAMITEVTIADYGKREAILSKTPGQLLVTAFENPQNYVSGWTAMAFETHDINIFALTDQVESWALTPLDGAMNFLRDTTFSFFLGSFVGTAIGRGIVGGGTMVWVFKRALVAGFFSLPWITPAISREGKEFFQGQLVDIDKAKASTTSCASVLEGTGRTAVALQYATYITLAASFVPITPVGLAGAALNLVTTYFASDYTEKTLKALHECAETDFRIVAMKKSDPIAVKGDVAAALAKNPAVKSIMDSISTATPDIAKELNGVISSAEEQTLNLRGEVGNSVTRVLPDKTYYLYLYRAALDWFQLGLGCDMQLCSKDQAGMVKKCASITETAIKDDAGNIILEKEHVRGFRIDKEMKYAYLPQKVINVKIGDGKKILDVDSSGVSISGCLESEAKSLLKTTDGNLLKRSFGRLDAIATKEAAVLFDNNRNLQVQFIEPYCGQNAGSWVSIPNGRAEIYADAAGTVKVPGLKDGAGKDCDLHMPIRNAASFENALVMPSLDGNVYHVMIYGLVEEDIGNLESFKTSSMCRLEDGTPGVKLSTTFRDPAMTQQYGDLLNDICMTQIRGQQNETITFEKGADGKDYMNVVDASGNAKRYQVIGYGTTMCKDSMEVSDIGTNVRQCFRGYKNQDGIPTYGFFDNSGRQVGAPIPMFWSNGLGGMMLYNPDTGKISIRNEFPLSMNPAFNTLGMMSTPYGTGFVPGLPPGGNPNAGRGTGGAGIQQPNLLASLPWTPEGPELAIFLLAIAGMLIAIRIRNPERKRR